MIWKISLLYARRPSVGFGPSWIPAARSFSHSKSSATWVAAIRHPLRSATAHQSWCVLFRAVQPTAPDCQEVCDAGQGLCIEKSSRLLPFKSHFHFPLSYTECERLQNMWRENKRPKRLQNMCWERFCWKQVCRIEHGNGGTCSPRAWAAFPSAQWFSRTFGGPLKDSTDPAAPKASLTMFLWHRSRFSLRFHVGKVDTNHALATSTLPAIMLTSSHDSHGQSRSIDGPKKHRAFNESHYSKQLKILKPNPAKPCRRQNNSGPSYSTRKLASDG